MPECEFIFRNPVFEELGYVIGIANLNDKHDRSAPSNYHWKILKCRMIIFSNSSMIASPDKNELKKIHIVFNKVGDDYDKLMSLFLKFSLVQEGEIRAVTPEVFHSCFQYTMTAKIAPVWNTLGNIYLVNNRDFLTAMGPQDGVQFNITCNGYETTLKLKAVKINLMKSRDIYLPGEWIRVLPSLNKAVVEEYCERLPQSAQFNSYKNIRRHWKNIHGYRLTEEECPYYLIRFWRGEPLTYPKICVLRQYPIITPAPKHTEIGVISRFIQFIKNKMPHVLGTPLTVHQSQSPGDTSATLEPNAERHHDTQAISLCTPTQASRY